MYIILTLEDNTRVYLYNIQHVIDIEPCARQMPKGTFLAAII